LPVDADLDDLLRRLEESERRSRTRRSAPPRRRSTARLLVVLVAVGAAALWVSGERQAAPRRERVAHHAPAPVPVVTGVAASSAAAVPSPAAIRRAWRYARRRGGAVSLAVVDTRGRLRGRAMWRRYPSASVVKAMLLAAELRRLRRARQALDGPTLELLRAMITLSDNDSADAIYARVGDTGLRAVARATGMRRFGVAASWGYAQITAADLAVFFARLRAILPRRQRRTALGLLSALTPEHRWGLVRAARGRWRAYAKGGWRETGKGELVHQAAWLRDGGRSLAVAILTDGQPSHLYGVHTVRGIANRLLRP